MRWHVRSLLLLPLVPLVLLVCPHSRVTAERLAELELSGPSRVRISAGWFTMGSDDDDVAYAAALCRAEQPDEGACRPDRFDNEQPRHQVHTSAFLIDRTEVTNADYRRCVAASRCAPARLAADDVRLGHPTHPVAGVTHAEAAAYCAAVGGQLPTEAQWERAARGGSVRRFPWGTYYNSRIANHGSGAQETALLDGYRFAAPVGALADGRSAQGLFDMAGNVWEFTADRYLEDAYKQRHGVDPVVVAAGPAAAGTPDTHVIRGGSWRSPAFMLRATHRGQLPDADSRPDVGFRCAYNVPASAPPVATEAPGPPADVAP